MRVTKKKIREAFTYLNELIFDSQLEPFSHIDLHPWDKSWPGDDFDTLAYCTYETDDKTFTILAIVNRIDSDDLFLNVLGHEMVHLYELQVEKKPMSHGKRFFSWKEKFAKFGLDLHEEYDV